MLVGVNVTVCGQEGLTDRISPLVAIPQALLIVIDANLTEAHEHTQTHTHTHTHTLNNPLPSSTKSPLGLPCLRSSYLLLGVDLRSGERRVGTECSCR